MGNTETLVSYSYQIKAFESQGDFIHGDYIILEQFYIPSENLSYHVYNNSLIIIEKEKNYEEYLKLNNINKKNFNDYDENHDHNKIFNLKECVLSKDKIDKIKQYFELNKQYYELNKQREKLYDEIVNC